MRRGKTVVEWGITFQSVTERDAFGGFLALQRNGKIRALQAHPKFTFIVNGVRVGTYTADGSYIDKDNALHVYDAKAWVQSKKTGKMLPRVNREFGLKCKLMKALFDIEVELI